ncbi:hypothetical protein [Candidatus Laterigemmans baculatus]|uniref:hypothetical protein n=1 Tax=Candidatus Laterigemmans baculatus TaxID=2770505 RepID=UPI0013DCC7E2|nr:hypothetical protein [Candidatus Laterigemmans baculatus]
MILAVPPLKVSANSANKLPTLNEFIEFLVVVTVTGSLMLFTPLWGPRVVYAGIARARKPSSSTRRGMPTFSIGDVGCLFIYVAMANALFLAVRHEYRHFPTLALVMPVFGNAFAILTWLLAVRFADDQLADTTRTRVAAILVFFPSAAIAVAHVAVSSLTLLSGLTAFQQGFAAGTASYAGNPIAGFCFVLLTCALMAVYILRRVFHARMIERER